MNPSTGNLRECKTLFYAYMSELSLFGNIFM